MDRERARRALKETARRHGVTEEQVVAEIEASIMEAISRAQREGNRKILEEWERVPCEGITPNAYELVAYIGGKISAS